MSRDDIRVRNEGLICFAFIALMINVITAIVLIKDIEITCSQFELGTVLAISNVYLAIFIYANVIHKNKKGKR